LTTALGHKINQNNLPVPVDREPVRRFLLIAAFSCVVCSQGVAQQSQSDSVPDAPSPSQQTQTDSQPANALQNSVAMVLTLQNRSRVFPDLATSTGPLDSWQKFKLAANNSLALSTLGAALVGSSYGQATDSPAGYGQEIGAYGKRFGADIARVASSNFFGTFLIASVTHEDPRFYVQKQSNLPISAEYAARRLVFTRTDSGKQVVNFYGLLGPLAGEALANTYYPQGSRGVGNTLIRYASDQGWRFCGNLLRQYWPTINRRLQLVPENSPTSTASKP
jgi:hypothetical protein